jgi:hypothetical protein
VNLAFLGGFDRRPLGPGWKKETFVSVLGGGEIDLTDSPPDGEGHLRIVAVLGGATVIVPAGTRVFLSGASILGGRSVNVREGDGPVIRVNALALLGGIDVREPKPGAL